MPEPRDHSIYSDTIKPKHNSHNNDHREEDSSRTKMDNFILTGWIYPPIHEIMLVNDPESFRSAWKSTPTQRLSEPYASHQKISMRTSGNTGRNDSTKGGHQNTFAVNT